LVTASYSIVFAELVLPVRVGNDQDISLKAAFHFRIGF